MTAVALTVAGCQDRASRTPIGLFDSRGSIDSLRLRLKATGGDPARIVVVQTSADLAKLTSGARYKFVVRADGQLVVAPLPADAPANEYGHGILADGGPVRTAGGIRVDRNGDAIAKIVLDQDSQAYCPSVDSLHDAAASLASMHVDPAVVRLENRPPNCLPVAGGNSPSMAGAPPVASGPRYGELMVEVGRRFDLLGRAAIAKRYELAEFELGELGEIFEGDLTKAEPPRESQGVNLAAVADSFTKTNLPDLEKAVKSHNGADIAQAYDRAAQMCNGCHKTSGHSFVEIATAIGTSVPTLTPLH